MTPMRTMKRSTLGVGISLVLLTLIVTLGPLAAEGQGQGQGQGNQPPLNVNVVNDPAKQPFNQTFVLDFGAGVISRLVEFDTVPAGKRLVVEHASLESRFPADDLVSARLDYRGTTGALVFQHLVIHAQGLDSVGKRVFAASEQLRAYISADETLRFIVARNSAGADVNAAVTVTVSGYFVDVP